jgi:hypothetical protein
MRYRPGEFLVLARTPAAAVATLMLMAICDAAWSQAASPPSASDVQTAAPPAAPNQPAPPPGQVVPPPAAPAHQENPGLLNEIGKIFEKSWSGLPAVKSPSETIDDLNARAKDAGDALSRMAKPSAMVSGRMICPVSANGAPDCKAASDKLCQSRGFREGKSLNTDSAETCSAKVLVPGRTRKPDDCRTDNYVTHALCQ